MTEAVDRWRQFDAELHRCELDWALHYAPSDLRWPRYRRYPYGAALEHLLPEDYRRFVAEVGYPVLGYRYYDSGGFSFLPPEAMGTLSTDVRDPSDKAPEPVAGAPTPCRYAFFAGFDLSEICGWALNEEGVWVIEDSGVVEPAGTFTEWLLSEVERQERRIAEVDAEDSGETDPHRLVDYSLEPLDAYDRPPYSSADLALNWVKGGEVHPPYASIYGLIDDTGRWRIPLGKRFDEVKPFRDGVAEVVLAEDGDTHRIDADGHLLD